MKVAKVSEEDIYKLKNTLTEIEWLSKEFKSGKAYSDIDWSSYEELNSLSMCDAEIAFAELCHKISNTRHTMILFNLMTLLDNCVDSGSEFLDFNSDIKEGLSLLNKKQEQEK